MSKANWPKYGISSGVCLALVVFYAGVRDFFAQELMEQFRILCDGFTVAGMLSIMAGVMLWVTNQGALDGIGYAAGAALRLLIPGRGNRREESYGAYVRRRQKKPAAWDFLLWSGAATVGISLIFLWLYYH